MRSSLSLSVSAALAVAIAVGPIVPGTSHAAGPSSMPGKASAKPEALNADAQAKFEAGDVAGAAATYAKILDVLPENKVNRRERDTFVTVTLAAYLEAYSGAVAQGQDKREAVELLRAGAAVFDAYATEYKRVYGGGSEPSGGASEQGFAVQTELKKVEAELAELEKPPEPKRKKKKRERKLKPIDVPTLSNGEQMIIGGAATMVSSLGFIPMIVIGAGRVKEAREDADEAMTGGETQAADNKGRSGQTLVVVGSVMMGVLLAGGATLLGLGIRRRLRYLSVAPTGGPGYVGVGLQGRF